MPILHCHPLSGPAVSACVTPVLVDTVRPERLHQHCYQHLHLHSHTITHRYHSFRGGKFLCFAFGSMLARSVARAAPFVAPRSIISSFLTTIPGSSLGVAPVIPKTKFDSSREQTPLWTASVLVGAGAFLFGDNRGSPALCAPGPDTRSKSKKKDDDDEDPTDDDVDQVSDCPF